MLFEDDMGVGIEGDADVGVAQPLLQHLVVAHHDRSDRLGRVAQALGSDAGDTGLLDERIHGATELLGSIQPPRAVVKTSPDACQAEPTNSASMCWRAR